ncbi:hypothetical protein FisN_13Hh061 [Fistulifera solaris]|uniref:Cwf19-like C-terminal domain-containing protein n=1 Tax=Fistulifera solaris TaxID=1519565 RepID=A0A1Z5KP08_FISSO|nr:hypothetical protein FisN_13Hh061 [Fistulifera solaris]|eukprot:GAX27832.1 hypothetical protein FisN_13Hh061 [Fistulifera solaris]
MLSGIKTGKAKRKPDNAGVPAAASDKDRNVSAAEELRLILESGKSIEPSRVAVSSSLPTKLSGFAALLDKDDTGMSQSDLEARNILRNTKRKRKLQDTSGDDDEAFDQMQSLLKEGKESSKQHRQTARYDRIQSLTSKCWWWLEAPTFDRHRLLVSGNHVTLVLAPSKLSLYPGEHFYLVPIQHVSSLAAADDQVWEEIERFQTSLRDMYSAKKKSIVCYEFVPPSQQFHQTRLEVAVIPSKVASDVPLFFRNALAEQASELSGTHTKCIDTSQKGLRRSVPAQMPYFYLEYGKRASMAQIVEERFPKDFAVDTLAGMLEMDPIRFRGKDNKEREYAQQFMEEWKSYDWTRR